MGRHDASDLARRLARDAEAVCRQYLSNGRRQGRYWMVGDVRNTPGRSMFVRLSGPESGPGAAGHWTDAASSEYGDLLDVIRESCGLVDFKDVADEAHSFLNLPRTEPDPPTARQPRTPAPIGSLEAARRIFAMSQSIERTLVETYLRNRGITALHGTGSLRFHPCCYHRPDEHSPTEIWPAMIAAVTDLSGQLTGVHRTWLDPGGFSETMLGKAPIDTPRRAMGQLLVSVRKHVESLEPFVIQGERSDSEERPMWTKENRGRYDRSKLRYPSDLTDEEWELIRPEIQPAKRGGNKRTVDIREIINAIMYVLSTGCQWRAIPKDLPPRSTVHDYFDLWTYDGTLDRIHFALYVKCREFAEREASPTAAIIDSQSVKSAEKGGPRLTRTATMRERRSRARNATF